MQLIQLHLRLVPCFNVNYFMVIIKLRYIILRIIDKNYGILKAFKVVNEFGYFYLWMLEGPLLIYNKGYFGLVVFFPNLSLPCYDVNQIIFGLVILKLGTVSLGLITRFALTFSVIIEPFRSQWDGLSNNWRTFKLN